MSFPATIDLSTLNGVNGFRIDNSTGVAMGRALAVGDFNGDGAMDIVVGQSDFDSDRGLVRVVYGPFDGSGGAVEISTLPGFALPGGQAEQEAGTAVAVLDINGDGYDDLVVGAPQNDFFGEDSGAAFVVFGSADGIPDLTDLSDVNGTNGFVFLPNLPYGYAGRSVASAGDLNGDGIEDLVVGVGRFGSNSPSAAYVIFGRASFASGFMPGDLDGMQGFAFGDASDQDWLGFSVSGAGDFNGDGVDDLIVGAPLFGDDGTAFIIFGVDGGVFSPQMGTNEIDGFTGIRIEGVGAYDLTGLSVSRAGDVNGDGFDDVIIGAAYADTAFGTNFGAAYVVFGSANPDAVVSLADLDGSDGFKIVGPGKATGMSVSAAGDIDEDGFDDLIIGAPYASAYGSEAGAAYVVLGSSSGFGAEFDLSTLDGTNGFVILPDNPDDELGTVVLGAQDVNGDGISDLLIGAPDYPQFGDGAVYVIFGGVVANFTGGAGDETAQGRGLADNLTGGGGKDTLSGMGGDDTIDGGDQNDVLDGGAGDDSVNGGNGNDTIQGGDGDDLLTDFFGSNKLNGGAGADFVFGGAGADRLDGGDGDDILGGGGGNDYLDGGTGADFMSGGTGNDVFIVRTASDTVGENAGEGTDTVRSMVDYTLGDDVEVLELLTGLGLTGIGNAFANTIKGNGGGNLLLGLAGNDKIDGGGGADTILGGLGRDQLTGGAGADTFRVVSESVGLAAIEIDTVLDYELGIDRLDFEAIDADGDAGNGDQVFTVSTTGLHRIAGELYVFYTASQDTTTVRLDVNGDGRADYQMAIHGNAMADAGNWLL